MSAEAEERQGAARRPNVVLILADDLGFADLGCTGSEIRTPVIDALARNGLLFTSMYNCARCCPTRAALLTGLYPHKAGIGHMGAHLGTPAYRGHLASDAVTVAETLRAAGYRTLMSGKWHVGGDFMPREVDSWRTGDLDHPTPRQRGFDRFYGIVDGVTHFFSPHCILRDDERIDVSTDDFYFTDAITDAAIGMVEESVALGQPFFLYLAHAAPHWPLHARPDDIAAYDGVYDRGWDAIRTARRETMRALGVLEKDWEISPRDPDAPPFAAIEHPEWEAARMAVYAAMVEAMDRAIGRLVDRLRALGQFEDTLVLFLSDNGGCAEFMAEDGWAKFMPDIHNDGRRIAMGNRPDIAPGGPLTYMSYDLPWANVSNAPFRRFKHWVHEGGISTPLVAHWPAGLEARGVSHAALHVVDIAPTLFDICGAAPLTEIGGEAAQEIDGESFAAAFRTGAAARQRPIFWEHEGNAGVRLGDRKLVRVHGGPWELYDIVEDRTELRDIAGRDGPTRDRLSRAYEDWADAVGVLDWDRAFERLKAAWGVETPSG